ncbi:MULTISPECIES: Gfo/Idh/MocA family protein [unclassified Curtobacterium]|uniref:Gfo/Idh/MocA family protein n=1 Tax=unclassified Curtobacterium TaxID=257496 RepID=UPI000DAAB328|nr:MULTISPECIES: Gfo/Idh/MocA family oxidoreductase [unclassified Curtobacterium]PZE27358.1 gfo/Idh/MocA family oxidoreductase [Curtobacterium sp. MCBD17_028]PZF60115.1 gfo/Idh/MocA family oxidoreductase [Curtobacterium sp. MCBD17_034]PZM34800.1 gfo/Idh/MocA family oxidoreductase [Curtobacterium sp. MCBD17_031]
MTFTIGMVGAGQFSAHFAALFQLHPGIDAVFATDVIEGRADRLVDELGLAGTHPDLDAMLADPHVDAVAIFTQRWTHGPIVVKALRAGKHVYSAVPMAVSESEIAEVIDIVRATGLTYMMGETSQYNPATMFARQQLAAGAFGRVFYAEGDYLHDMDLGFYDAYRYSGGDGWKATASYPPMWYPTHAIGGVLGAIPQHAVSVSCIGVHDDRDDGVFDTAVSMFDNDFSNMTALFELDGGGSMRINEFRRVGYPSPIRESRFRWFGTEGSFEQLATTSIWQDKHGAEDVSDLIASEPAVREGDPLLADIAPSLRGAFSSGHAKVHAEEARRLPREFDVAPDGHEGSHRFLADDFVRAVEGGTLPTVNAWVAARYTLPGLVAFRSALRGGERLSIPDFGDAPVPVGTALPGTALPGPAMVGSAGSATADGTHGDADLS